MPQAAMAPPTSPPSRASGPPAAPVAPQVPSMQPPRPAAPSRDDIGQTTRPSSAPLPDMRASDVPIGAPAARSVAPAPPSAASATPFPMPRAASPMADSPTVQSARADATAANAAEIADQSVPRERSQREGASGSLARWSPISSPTFRRNATRDCATARFKQLFREEIKKSYEEYVDQVGKEFAESTTHFQDALNDILAGGKKIF